MTGSPSVGNMDDVWVKFSEVHAAGQEVHDLSHRGSDPEPRDAWKRLFDLQAELAVLTPGAAAGMSAGRGHRCCLGSGAVTLRDPCGYVRLWGVAHP
jgi:hypothetical protein